MAIMGVGFLLRTHEIATLDCSFDECSSWKSIQFSWAEMFHSISRNVHPPVFYVLLKLWSYAFGDGPIALRLFSVLFGTLTIWAASWFCKEACRPGGCDKSASDNAAPLIAAALIAISPAHVSLSLVARMYTLGTFLALISATFVVRIVRTGGTAFDWTGCAVAGVLLTLTHHYGLFTAAALALIVIGRAVHESVVLGWTRTAKCLLTGTSLSAWGAAILWRFWLPTFLAQRARVEQDYWIRGFEWSNLSSAWTELLSGNEIGSEIVPPWTCLLFAAVVSSLAFACCGRVGRVAGTAAMIPVIAATVISINSQSIVLWRYFILSQTFVLAAWAMLIARERLRMIRSVLVGLSVGWLGFWSLQLWNGQSWKSDCPGYRSVARALDEWRQDHEPVLVYDPASYLILQRYADKRDNLFVIDRGYKYKHYEAGPLLRPTDYLSVEDVRESTSSIFVVHLPKWFTDVPSGWRQRRTQQFECRVGRTLHLVVRDLRRDRQRALSVGHTGPEDAAAARTP